MEFLKKLGRVALLALVFVSSFHVAVRATWPDPEAEVGVLRMLTAGIVGWRVGTNSGNDLVFNENSAIGAPVLSIESSSGGLVLRARTSAQLQLLAPGQAGEIAFNTTTANVCMSTGTGAGAWVYPSSSTTGSTSNARNTCY